MIISRKDIYMIAKSDVILLLTELQNKGIDVKDELNLVLRSQTIPLEALKKINDNRSLDILKFYEKIRKSYNNKKSKLYINIMRADENVISNPKTIVTTLSALLNQILQYKPDDQALFYKHARADEIVKCLSIYFNTYNLEPSRKLLEITKADVKCLQMIK